MMILVALSPHRAGAQATHIAARLISESPAVTPGGTMLLALDMRPEPGWHGYWHNPGDAGFEPRFTWSLPEGVGVGAPAFPVPRPLLIAGLMNYVFEGDHALLFKLRLRPGLSGKLPLHLSADWLACTDQVCVPEHGEFALVVEAKETAPPVDPASFDRFRAALPAPLAATARYERLGDRLRLAIPLPASAAAPDPHFFPDRPGMITDAAPQAFARVGDMLVATLETSGSQPVSGVLALGDGRGLSFAAVSGAVPAPPDTGWQAILLAIGGAMLGGLLLNVMPCVFPILSLKALALASPGTDERSARRQALAYAAGTIFFCVALGAAAIALKLGWAFQLQDPRVVLALLLAVTAVTLNLAGVFELPGLGGRLSATSPFATGALAAIIATPCTGPFMGAALGAALVLPPAAAIGVFVGLGLGLALPFLVIGFVPGLRNRLPKPGAWMVQLRRALAIPMLLTGLWLAWLLWRQIGSAALLSGAISIAVLTIALAWGGERQRRGKSGLAVAATAALALAVTAMVRLPIGATTVASLSGEAFSEIRLAQLRQEGRPLFVYFTADWCLTCKVNERLAIDTASTRAAFAKAGITTLVGDWTRNDPAITRFLEANRRAGVPLYLYYAPGAAMPRVLPQLLTPGILASLKGV